jgi:hypothetical protein
MLQEQDTRPEFKEYLNAYWTYRGGIIKLTFPTQSPDVIKFPHQPPVVIHIDAIDFDAGNLEFSLEGHPHQIGWIRKLWNADAIGIQMPGKKTMNAYRYLPIVPIIPVPLRKSK